MNPARTVLFLAATSLLLGGCPTSTDTEGTDTDVVDTDPCANAPEREAFIEAEADRFCDYLISCPGRSEDDREACLAEFRYIFSNASCFDSCKATVCSAWLDAPPACVDEGSLPDECADAIACE